MNRTSNKSIFIRYSKSRGYELLSEYKNNRTKVTLRCRNGHLWETLPLNFKNKECECPKCIGKCPEQNRENFIKLIELDGYIIYSGYKSNSKKVDLICPVGHIWSTTPNNYKNGNRCGECLSESRLKNKENILSMFYDSGYELLSEYISSDKKVKVKCPQNHVYMVLPYNFKQGCRCPKCSKRCPIQSEIDFVKSINDGGYELLSEYKKVSSKVDVKCSKGHLWTVTPNKFKNGNRCPHCKGSTGQRQLQDILSDYVSQEVIYNDRKTLHGLEIDIYYPDIKFGIEYQGNYWHVKPDIKERDSMKRRMCKEYGIELVEVWEDDFKMNPDHVVRWLVNNIQSSTQGVLNGN